MRRTVTSALAIIAFAAVAFLSLTASRADATHTCLPSTTDGDGDGLPVTCDPSDLNVDFDFDSFTDSVETYVGTNPAISCSFPPDVDDNGTINIFDVLALKPPFDSHASDPNFITRVDLTADEYIDIFDVLALNPWFGQNCPFSVNPVSTTVELREENGHFSEAQVFSPDVGHVYVVPVGGIPTCQ
ncbi:MAG TPA: hypothetical protein VIT93_05630, partial [Dehalococcoidia bacterium]